MEHVGVWLLYQATTISVGQRTRPNLWSGSRGRIKKIMLQAGAMKTPVFRNVDSRMIRASISQDWTQAGAFQTWQDVSTARTLLNDSSRPVGGKQYSWMTAAVSMDWTEGHKTSDPQIYSGNSHTSDLALLR